MRPLLLLWAALAAGFSPAFGEDAASSPWSAPAPASQAGLPPGQQGTTLADILRRISLESWQLTGSGSIVWRNVGPKTAGFETQIQNEVYLADMYLGARGPVLDGVPVLMEMQYPTSARGVPNLYRFQFDYNRIQNWDFTLGKFLIPFGRYNELYRPDMFLTVTRPLLYASPDSLDLVVRLNSPSPPFSSGYTDIGARVSCYPPSTSFLIPSEMTFYVVNGLSQSSNPQRTFPSPTNLGVPQPPSNGVSIDFGHQNNNLADNNNNKAVGGRLVWALGSLNLPWPIPEGKRDLTGIALGVSGMYGSYDLEDQALYKMLGVDLAFEYQGINISAEYEYNFLHVKSPLEAAPSSTTLLSPTFLLRDYQEEHGYYIQASFPLWKHPRWGKRVMGVLVFNQLFRRGPQYDLLTNQLVDGTLFPSIAAANPVAPRITTWITKTTGAINYQMTDHFIGKIDYSYWTMTHASTIGGTRDVYQGAFSLVVAF